MKSSLLIRIAAPILFGVVLILLWEFLVRHFQVRIFVLPPPSAIWASLIENFPSLMGSLWFTFRITMLALILATLGGVALAFLFTTSRAAVTTLFPYAVVLQVTPVVSIAPLILIWVGVDHVERALLILAWIVAFFPILSNTVFGLKSVDPNLRDLFRIYGASRWQVLLRLNIPSALPNFLAGLKISGGLSLVGTVVAEFVAGSGGSTGLAWRIMEAGNRLQIPKMFAALLLLSFLGIAIYFSLSALEHLLLRRWHASARRDGA